MSKADIYNLKPAYKEYVLTDIQLEQIFSDLLEKETGYPVDVYVYVDGEVDLVSAQVDCSHLTEEEEKEFLSRLPEGMYKGTLYENARILGEMLFVKGTILYFHEYLDENNQEETDHVLIYARVPIVQEEKVCAS